MAIENRTIFEGDNLPVLRGMQTASIDLIYLDPPFNSNKTYSAPIGSEAAGAAFKDSWTLDDVKDEWHKVVMNKNTPLYKAIESSEFTHSVSMKAYLIMMAVRLIEMQRILKPTGSIYLHCDPTASHYLKMVMDGIFGKDQFRNEILWCYTRMSAKGQKQLSRAHDIILWYSMGDTWCFNVDDIRLPYAESSKAREGHTLNKLGSGYSKEGVTVLNNKGKFPEDWITHIPYLRGKERCGYPTQKPLKLLDRIIKASSNIGDIVLDPFCGCATTCIAAELLSRRWIGIDISSKAVELVNMRIEKEVGMFAEVIHRTDVPGKEDPVPLSDIKDEVKSDLYKKSHVCPGCNTEFPERNFHIDHIKPKSKGGTDDKENLQLLCGACNSTKSSGTMIDLAKRNLEDNVIDEDFYREIVDKYGYNQEAKSTDNMTRDELEAHIEKIAAEVIALQEKEKGSETETQE